MNGAWRTISVALRADGVGKFQTDMGRAGSSTGTLGKAIRNGAAVGVLALGALGFAASTVAAEFDSKMSAVAAVSGATSAELDTLREKALQLGADTSFSASEAADAMGELVKAGVSVEGVLNGAADATVALAAAGEVDLAQAATIAANAMNQFGLSAEELPRIADLIAGAANASAIEVSDFGMSMSQAGAVAKLVGVDFEDAAVAITAMGNAGIVGSDAGTSLKTFLMNLTPTTVRAREEMQRLGIITEDGKNRFFDARGEVEDFATVADILGESMAGMGREQKLAALNVLFGSDAIRAAAVIADQGAAGWRNLSDAIGSVSAEEVAATRLDNLNGSIEAFKGSVETLLIQSGGVVNGIVRPLVDGATELVNQLATADPAEVFRPVLDVLALLGPAWEDVVDTGENFLDIIGDLESALGPAVDLLGRLGGAAVIGAITGLASALSGVSGFLADHPVLIQAVVVALGTLAGVKAINLIVDQFDRLALSAFDAAGAVDRSKLAQNLGNIVGGLKTMTIEAFKVPAWNQTSTAGWTAGTQQVAAGFRGITSSISAVTIGLAGVTALIVAVSSGISKAHQKAQAEIDALKPADMDPRSLDDLIAYQTALGEMTLEAENAADKNRNLGGIIKGAAQLMTPMENAVIDQAIAAGDMEAAYDAATEALDRLFEGYKAASQILGMSSRDVEKWVMKLDLPSELIDKPDELAAAIDTARSAAEAGTPETDKLSEAYATLADETSNATEKITAWKDSLDAALGVQMSIFDATTAFEGSLDNVTDTLAKNFLGTLDATTEAGRNNRSALSDAAKSAIDLVQAYADTGDITGATLVLEQNRQKLIDLGGDSEAARNLISDFLDEIGLTPELVETQFTLTGVDGATTAVSGLNAELAMTAAAIRSIKEIGQIGVDLSLAAAEASLPGRALGGRVRAGQAYLVGEHRPEVFQPDQDGRIWPSIASYPQPQPSPMPVVTQSEGRGRPSRQVVQHFHTPGFDEQALATHAARRAEAAEMGWR